MLIRMQERCGVVSSTIDIAKIFDLSMMYKVPLSESCSRNPSRGGSMMTFTLSSEYLRTGGMSLNEFGVDAMSSLCSSGVTNVGFVDIAVIKGMVSRISTSTLSNKRLKS